MKELSAGLPGLRLFELVAYKDERGFFMERFRDDQFSALGFHETFVQDNHSRSLPNVLRGLHYQTAPQQGKLVNVIRGRIFDVVVDLRKGSATFGKWYGTELSDENMRTLWIPFGFAHGFCVLGNEPADVTYKVTGFYNGKTEGGLAWNDPALGIEWPVGTPIVSAKDRVLPLLKNVAPI